jgi:hypothetical protein
MLKDGLEPEWLPHENQKMLWQAVVIPTPSRSRLSKMLNLLNRARKRAVVFDFCHGLLRALPAESSVVAEKN